MSLTYSSYKNVKKEKNGFQVSKNQLSVTERISTFKMGSVRRGLVSERQERQNRSGASGHRPGEKRLTSAPRW